MQKKVTYRLQAEKLCVTVIKSQGIHAIGRHRSHESILYKGIKSQAMPLSRIIGSMGLVYLPTFIVDVYGK